MWTILYFFPVKQKFGDNNKDSEVFVVAPSTAPLNPVLVDRFSGEIKKKFVNKRNIFCTLHKAEYIGILLSCLTDRKLAPS